MKKDNTIFLKHILESITHIEHFVKNKSKNDFKNSVQLQDAVIRRIEIIGEAAKNMDESFKEANMGVEWKKIAGMRDVIIHKYFGVDLELVWNVILKDLPKLKKEIKKILGS